MKLSISLQLLSSGVVGARVGALVGPFVGACVGGEGVLIVMLSPLQVSAVSPLVNPHASGQLTPTSDALRQSLEEKQYLLRRSIFFAIQSQYPD